MKRSSLKCTALVLTMSILLGICGCDSEDPSGSTSGSSTGNGSETTDVSTDTSDTSGTSQSEDPTTATPSMDMSGDDIPEMATDAEAVTVAIQALDKDTLGTLCMPEGNALNNVVVPDGAADLFLLYFWKTNFQVKSAKGRKDVAGNVQYEVTMVDLASILPGLGEVYTYGDVYDAVYAATDANMVTKEIVVPFAYDPDSGKYLASDTSEIVNEFLRQLSQIVLLQYISQDEVNLATVALMSAIGSNDVATANSLAGGQIMTDWGIYAPLIGRLYTNVTYEVDIITPGVTSTLVTIHAHFHDANAAMNDLAQNHPAELAPAFAEYVYTLIKNKPEAAIDYSLMADVFESCLRNAPIINADVTCTMTKNPDGSLVFEPSVEPLVYRFDPTTHWSTTIPTEILLPTTDYLFAAGRINEGDKNWIYILQTTNFAEITVTPGDYACYTEVFACYFENHRALPGIQIGAFHLDFLFCFDTVLPAGTTISSDWIRDGKSFYKSTTSISSDRTEFLVGIYQKSGKPYESGSYQINVYAPNDTTYTQLMCTITFTIP